MKFRFPTRHWFWLALLLGFTAMPSPAKPAKMRDIADTIYANPILTKFTAMIQAADLGTFLSSRGPFTVFAPTDSAFARLPPGMFDTLLRPENKERLADIVLFHVVNGKRLTAMDLKTQKSILSCQGNPLNFRLTRLGTEMVMKAKITHADIHCQNGIVSQIDTLLMPPETALPPVASAVPPAAVVTNTPPANQDAITTVSTTNVPPTIPVAPIAVPEASPH